MSTELIDSHHHFWRYSPEEYDWIDDSLAALRRDFLPEDLKPLLDAAGIDGCIAVQVRQSIEETRFMLGLAKANPWIRGVVGWVDLRSEDCASQLDCFRDDPRLIAIRHIAQAEADDFLLGEAFGRGIAELAAHDLAYDLLVFPRQLEAAIGLVSAHPDQRFVLDHLAKPDLRGGDLGDWATSVQRLAQAPNVACKLSGLATEADWQNWTPDTLRPAFATVLDAFGPDRLLFGSDWPVCLSAVTYARWFDTASAWLEDLTTTEKAAILGGNTARWYRLP